MTFPDGCRLRRVAWHGFASSGLEEFRAPPGLRVLDDALGGCKRLRRVALNEGLEELQSKRYAGNFQRSGLEEIVLPRTLREIP